jgi:hypothetical protein
MPSFEETLPLLANLLDLEKKRIAERMANLTDANLPKALRDELDSTFLEQISQVRKATLRELDKLVRYPPFHSRHFYKLAEYYEHAGCGYEKSVFIMTKFPEGDSPLDQQLRRVIKAVKTVVNECGHAPRIATDKTFHPLLWDNVELYLLASRGGIAILEDKYKPELNPNVAMEWGWMRGMGREILPLVEDGFDYRRADWGGLIENRFEWDKPEETIRPAVKAWLAPP